MRGSMTIAVSAGDPQGIGPEITVAAVVAVAEERAELRFRVHGAPDLGAGDRGWERLRAAGRLELVPHPFDAAAAGPAPSAGGGAAALAAFAAAAEDAIAGRAEALCTAPLAKEAVERNAPGFTGHTGWLARRVGAEALMCLASERLRVMLLTEHLPLGRVADALSIDLVARKLRLARRALVEDLGI